ncbi:MAG: hypothetical protein A2Y07_01390 [Planctomycetes bacterium GWF2_50_10]|nr:MAG: hypothetical protein A2Y07_01390 [Planctomycetes bacterium GWF2_50_10]
MPEYIVILILVAVIGILSGPVALVVSIVNAKRIAAIEEGLAARRRAQQIGKAQIEHAPGDMGVQKENLAEKPVIEESAGGQERLVQDIIFARPTAERPKENIPITPPPTTPMETAGPAKEKLSFEVMVGTKWMAIAGAIAMIIGVIAGLKYMYDNAMIGAMGRTIIVACWGLAAIVVGQITRVRGYDIAAKALTALGFALLYSADFAAFGLYELIGAEAALGLAILITAGGVLYAVSLNEVVMAFLAMLGGYLSPVLLSTGENRPNALFGYITILSVGVMLAAVWRKWRSVNILAFVGTAVLYGAWFWKYYSDGQIATAITWLGVFFVIFLTIPIMHELWRGAKARREDVLGILANAIFTFGFLTTMLWDEHRRYLALAAVVLGAAHFAMMGLVHRRSAADTTLKILLGLIGLAFITVAMGLYLKFDALTMAYFAEAFVLTAVAARYRSLATRISSIAVAVLAVVMLLKNLPMHDEAFGFIFNAEFGIWVFGAAAFYACSLIYRSIKDGGEAGRVLAQCYFAAAMMILVGAVCMEWYWNCYFNKHGAMAAAMHGIMAVLAGGAVIAILPKFKAAGQAAFGLSVAGASIAFVLAFIELLNLDRSYFEFWNSYLIAGCITAVLFYVCSLMYRFIDYCEISKGRQGLTEAFFAAAMIVLFMALHNEWYEYWSRFGIAVQTANYLWGLLCGLLVFSVAAIWPRFSPRGQVAVLFSGMLLIGAMVFSAHRITDLNWGAQYVYFNTGFLYAISPAFAAVVVAEILRRRQGLDEKSRRQLAGGCYLAIIIFVWIVLTKQMYQFWKYWQYNPRGFEIAGDFNLDKGQMWVSIIWAGYAAAIMTIGLWRKVVLLRYVGFAFITVTVVKVFLYDTRKLEGLYQIASFVMLGAVLIGLSYLYQFLRKKGFFERGTTR